MAKDHGALEAGQLPRLWTRGRRATEICQRVSGEESVFQSDHFVLSTNFLFKFNVSLPLVTGELLQNTVDVNNVTYKLYNIKFFMLCYCDVAVCE